MRQRLVSETSLCALCFLLLIPVKLRAAFQPHVFIRRRSRETLFLCPHIGSLLGEASFSALELSNSKRVLSFGLVPTCPPHSTLKTAWENQEPDLNRRLVSPQGALPPTASDCWILPTLIFPFNLGSSGTKEKENGAREERAAQHARLNVRLHRRVIIKAQDDR